MPRKKKTAKPKLPPFVTLRKGGEWHVRVGFPTKIRDAKGRIIYEQFTRKCEPRTPERAAEIVQFLRAEYQRTATPTDAASTVAEFIQRFLDAKAGSIAPRTHGYYEYLFKRHIETSGLGHKPLRTVSPLDIQSLYSSVKSTSNSRVRKLHVLLSMAFRQAVLWQLIESNPCSGVILPKVERSESRAMTSDEARRFLKACRSDDRFIIFELALETGLRPQECTALRWQDVDLKNRRIRVRQAATADFDRTNARIGETKTKHSVRTIGISPQLTERLQVQRGIVDAMIAEAEAKAGKTVPRPRNRKGSKHQRRQSKKAHATAALLRLKHFDLVFPSANGGIKALDNLNKREFRQVTSIAGLEPGRYSFKSLRHTCATILAEALHPKKLQRHLGHSSATTTLNYYVHVDDGSQFDASEAMQAFYGTDP